MTYEEICVPSAGDDDEQLPPTECDVSSLAGWAYWRSTQMNAAVLDPARGALRYVLSTLQVPLAAIDEFLCQVQADEAVLFGVDPPSAPTFPGRLFPVPAAGDPR